MIHTGNGVPQALPSLCIPIARKYPHLKIILAHAGGGMFACEALIVAQECPNVYLETSWVNPADMGAIMNSLSPDRIMFGTDIYQNVAPSLSIYYDGGYSEGQLAQVLGQTAIDIFHLNQER
jgi:predicted TIM-barrel fold metal-dependent hydrolase